jgi:hypothetical protein
MTGVMAARLVPLVQGGAWMFGLKWFVLVALTAGLVGWQTPGAQPLPPGGAVRAVVPPRPVPVLVVTADKIRIDEKANLLWVDGPGTLRLQVKTSLLGQPLDRPAALNLRWSECLQFNGLHLFCRGTVALELGGTLVQCKAWYAKVTEMLPLTAALRGGQPATLELGKGDGDVCLTWPVGPWVLKGLTGRELGLDAVQNALTVTGPGTLEVVPNPAPEDKQPPPVPLRIAFEKGFMTCQNGSYLAADAARVEFGTEPATTLQGKEIQFRLIRGPKGDLYRRWSAQGRAAWNGAGMEATAQHIAVEETRQIMDLRGTPEKPAQVRSEIGYGPPQIVTGQAIRITTDNGKRLVEVR